MKKLALLATLLFSVMFSSASYAEWTKVNADTRGNTFDVDFERIRKHYDKLSLLKKRYEQCKN